MTSMTHTLNNKNHSCRKAGGSVRASSGRFSSPFAFVACLLVIFLMFAGDSTISYAQQNNNRLDTVTLQLKWKHQFQFAGFYAAQKQGYYRQVGLNVQFLEPPMDKPTSDVVTFGEADFGIGGSDLVTLYARGRPLVALAAIYQESPLTLLARRDSNISTLADLRNKKLAIEEYSGEVFAMLQKQDIQAFSLNLLPHSLSAKELLSGEVDGISAYETTEAYDVQPFIDNIIEFNPKDYDIHSYGDILYTTSSILRDRPQLVKRFLDASLRGWEYAYLNHQEMIDYIYQMYPNRLSYEALKFEAEKSLPLLKPTPESIIGEMTHERWQEIINFYQQTNLLDQEINLDDFLYDQDGTEQYYHFFLLILGLASLFTLVRAFKAIRPL